MPTAEENVQYLYLVLTAGGAPNIDMAAVSKTLSLSTGAVSKRWSRLKQAMEGGRYPGPSAYEFLWLCVKHNLREKALDWHDIAEKCGTTAGAASKRYSRMKQAFERGDAAPTTPSKPKNSSNTNPSSPKGTTPTPKRKRPTATPKKKVAGGEERFKPDDEEDDAEEYLDKKPKRVRGGAGGNAAKPRATSKPKGKQTAVKEESNHSAGFLALNGNSIGYTNGNHPPTPNLSGSRNPTEATTLIKTDPDAPHTHSDPMQGPLDGAPVNDDQEHFYDANEILGEEEETFTQENVLTNHVGNSGLQEWLEETEI